MQNARQPARLLLGITAAETTANPPPNLHAKAKVGVTTPSPSRLLSGGLARKPQALGEEGWGGQKVLEAWPLFPTGIPIRSCHRRHRRRERVVHHSRPHPPHPSPFPGPASFARVHRTEAGETSSSCSPPRPPHNVSRNTSLTPNVAVLASVSSRRTVRSSATRASAATSGGLTVDVCPVSVTEMSKLDMDHEVMLKASGPEKAPR